MYITIAKKVIEDYIYIKLLFFACRKHALRCNMESRRYFTKTSNTTKYRQRCYLTVSSSIVETD